MPNNRNRSRGSQFESFRQQQDWDRDPYRQQEQFQRDMDDQYGETRASSRDYQPQQYDRSRGSESFAQSRFSDPATGYSERDYDPLGDYDRAAAYATRPRSYGAQGSGPTHNYFRADDFGGQDYTRSTYSGSATRPSRMGGYGARSDWSIPPRRYDEDERGFFDRASDEVMSWFGDDEAANRRRRDHHDHRGRGPSNYTKSDERLLEDACERLTNDYNVDASNINVTVASGEVTLDGTVDSRQAKRRAEDCVEDISGVKHVQNNLRVAESNATWNSASNNQSLKSSDKS